MSKEKYIVKFENRDEFIYYNGCYDDTYLIDKCKPVSLRNAKRAIKEYTKCYGKKEFVILPYEKTMVEYCKKYPLIVNDVYVIDDKYYNESQFKEYLNENNLIANYDISDISGLNGAKKCTKYTAEKGKCIRKDINALSILIYLLPKDALENYIEQPEQFKCLIKDYVHIEYKYNRGGGYYGFHSAYYFLKSDYDKLIEDCKEEHKAYVLKGTREPFYFKFRGEIITSSTKNWYEFLNKNYGIFEEYMLEEAPEEYRSRYAEAALFNDTNVILTQK